MGPVLALSPTHSGRMCAEPQNHMHRSFSSCAQQMPKPDAAMESQVSKTARPGAPGWSTKRGRRRCRCVELRSVRWAQAVWVRGAHSPKTAASGAASIVVVRGVRNLKVWASPHPATLKLRPVAMRRVQPGPQRVDFAARGIPPWLRCWAYSAPDTVCRHSS